MFPGILETSKGQDLGTALWSKQGAKALAAIIFDEDVIVSTL